MSIDFHWISIDFITFSAPEYFKPFENQPAINDFNIDQHWPTLINTGQHRWTLVNTVDIDQHWSILSNTDQHWPTLIITGEHWLNTASYPIPFHHIPSSLLCVHQMFRNPHTDFWKLRNLLAPSYPLWTDPLILPILPILQSCNHLTIQTSWCGTAECA